MTKEQRKTNHLEETYIVGSPDRYTRYSTKDGSVVLDIPPYKSKSKTPTPETRTATEGTTPAKLDISFTGEGLNWEGIFYNNKYSNYQPSAGMPHSNLSNSEISQAVGQLGLFDFTEETAT